MLVFKVPLILLVNQVERMVQMGTHNDIFLEKLILTLWLRVLRIRNFISWAYGFINHSTSTSTCVRSTSLIVYYNRTSISQYSIK
ncbi:unnamed protein product [Brassica oleracea var. botrytis]